MRAWCWGTVYGDGVLEVSASSAVDSTREVVAHGRVCANTVYKSTSGTPWYESRSSYTTVRFLADMSSLALLNMCYWFYSCGSITALEGIGNLGGAPSLRYAISSCTGVTALDFRRFDPSHLTDLFYCFAGCNTLTTIYADASWVLPTSGVSGMQCFYNCQALVGENGTAWTSGNTSYAYMRIDTSDAPGYLTAT